MTPRARAVRKVMAVKASFRVCRNCGYSYALHVWGSKRQPLKLDKECEGWNGA